MHKFNHVLALFILTALIVGCQSVHDRNAGKSDLLTFKVSSQSTHTIHPYLFGQFMERPSWGGEFGPEALVNPETGRLPDPIVDKLRELNPPIIRFPGGTDVDRMDWMDMIDNGPDRKPGEPRPISTGHTGIEVSNNFGIDEFLELREELGFEPLLVVNLREALTGPRSVGEAALHAAGMVAYCNAETGAKLPPGMPDWPAIRSVNGHPEPFGVKYWQIGNETWFFKDLIEKAGGIANHIDIIKEYIAAMRAVDPDIILIYDGFLRGLEEPVLKDPYIRENIQFMTYHTYGPWDYSNRKFKDIDSLTTDDWWHHWIFQPSGVNESGQTRALGHRSKLAIELGYEIACTEWNWNGWGDEKLDPQPECKPEIAKALGTAGYIHGMMREGAHLKLATQSMLMGTSWGITAIRASAWPGQDFDPWLIPQGQATELYNRLHGNVLYPVEFPVDMPKYLPPTPDPQTERFVRPANYVDLAVTGSEDALYVHFINFHRVQPIPVSIDLSGFNNLSSRGRAHTLNGPLDKGLSENEEILTESISHLELQDGVLNYTLSPHSITVVVIPATGQDHL